MKSLVLYDSKFGNTEAIARAIAEVLDAEAVRAGAPLDLEGVDLLVVGAPTQIHNVGGLLRKQLDELPAGALEGVAVAAFDTRFRRNRVLTGSAAHPIARRLVRRGGRLLAPPESFFVADTEGPLEAGEPERAAAWARALPAPLAPRPLARLTP